MGVFYFRLRKKLNEVFFIEPNDLKINFLTLHFKRITSYLKMVPFVYVIPLTMLVALILYLLLGGLLIRLVTILQYGF